MSLALRTVIWKEVLADAEMCLRFVALDNKEQMEPKNECTLAEMSMRASPFLDRTHELCLVGGGKAKART